jgi:hypothetical protein
VEVDRIAERILTDDPDPVVEFRLRRDVLGAVPALPSSLEIRSRWIRVLEGEQRADGGWGRFHSADSRARAAIPTAEFAIDRALALGLDAKHPVLGRAIGYMARLLLGEIEFPDRAERNDRWATGAQLFVAGTMARVDPNASELDEIWGLWATILERAFASGVYDPDAEALAHREITGASVANSYLVLSNRYAVALLGSRVRDLPAGTVRRYAEWLWSLPTGIGYLSVPLSRPPKSDPGGVDRWLSSLELVKPLPIGHQAEVAEWMWSQRQDGWWDFGPRWTRSAYLPLSEDWRRRRRRCHDHTTRILALLRSDR